MKLSKLIEKIKDDNRYWDDMTTLYKKAVDNIAHHKSNSNLLKQIEEKWRDKK